MLGNVLSRVDTTSRLSVGLWDEEGRQHCNLSVKELGRTSPQRWALKPRGCPTKRAGKVHVLPPPLHSSLACSEQPRGAMVP